VSLEVDGWRRPDDEGSGQDAQPKAAELFDAIAGRGLIAPGVRESAASNAIRDLAADMFGVSRHWHGRDRACRREHVPAVPAEPPGPDHRGGRDRRAPGQPVPAQEDRRVTTSSPTSPPEAITRCAGPTGPGAAATGSRKPARSVRPGQAGRSGPGAPTVPALAAPCSCRRPARAGRGAGRTGASPARSSRRTPSTRRVSSSASRR